MVDSLKAVVAVKGFVDISDTSAAVVVELDVLGVGSAATVMASVDMDEGFVVVEVFIPSDTTVVESVAEIEGSTTVVETVCGLERVSDTL